ncbi:hypothetical protein M0813_13989 [Anaeramoeba flamelloides]|uniref:Uncharacterized protein n=1 Tax=Anaeramoeba flamelloides TaxID=1746091 RepID=A0ABQ8Z6U5_9EUKA|nr:hypothetical protein M0813_13989 [Anaeramoeba flamelloides]
MDSSSSKFDQQRESRLILKLKNVRSMEERISLMMQLYPNFIKGLKPDHLTKSTADPKILRAEEEKTKKKNFPPTNKIIIDPNKNTNVNITPSESYRQFQKDIKTVENQNELCEQQQQQPYLEPPKKIKINRKSLDILSEFTGVSRRSLERGLSSFISRRYNLTNISPYSRKWLVFGHPPNKHLKKANKLEIKKKKKKIFPKSTQKVLKKKKTNSKQLIETQPLVTQQKNPPSHFIGFNSPNYFTVRNSFLIESISQNLPNINQSPLEFLCEVSEIQQQLQSKFQNVNQRPLKQINSEKGNKNSHNLHSSFPNNPNTKLLQEVDNTPSYPYMLPNLEKKAIYPTNLINNQLNKIPECKVKGTGYMCINEPEKEKEKIRIRKNTESKEKIKEKVKEKEKEKKHPNLGFISQEKKKIPNQFDFIITKNFNSQIKRKRKNIYDPIDHLYQRIEIFNSIQKKKKN